MKEDFLIKSDKTLFKAFEVDSTQGLMERKGTEIFLTYKRQRKERKVGGENLNLLNNMPDRQAI